MRGLTVSQRLFACFALIIAVMFGMSATFYLRAVSNHERAAEVLSSDLAGMGVAAQIRMALAAHFNQTLEMLRDTEANAGRTSGVSTENKARLTAIDASMDKAYTEYLATITLQMDRNATAEFARTLEEYKKKVQQMLELLEQGQTAQAAQLRNEQVRL